MPWKRKVRRVAELSQPCDHISDQDPKCWDGDICAPIPFRPIVLHHRLYSLSTQIPLGISGLHAHIWTPRINWAGITGKSFSDSVRLNGVISVFGALRLALLWERPRVFLFQGQKFERVSDCQQRQSEMCSHPHIEQRVSCKNISFEMRPSLLNKEGTRSTNLQQTVPKEHIIPMSSIWSQMNLLTLQTSPWESESSLHLH